jgi:hypothetical protein
VDERDVGGYSVAYSRDDIEFPVYLAGFGAAVFFGLAWFTGHTIWLVLAAGAAGVAYYNFPLLETGRPTIGANQYGVFIQGFGLVRWRAIKAIELIPIPDRASTVHEVQIALSVPFSSALVADWRKLPTYRSLMRLPWSVAPNNVIRVDVEPFDHPPDEIHRTLVRMWRYYRS